MVISIRQLSRYIQMLILVFLFSFVLFKMMEVVYAWMQPVDKYRVPAGDSLKVSSDLYPEQNGEDWALELIQRLKVFYYTGE